MAAVAAGVVLAALVGMAALSICAALGLLRRLLRAHLRRVGPAVPSAVAAAVVVLASTPGGPSAVPVAARALLATLAPPGWPPG